MFEGACMSSKKITIVCDGKEISYGLNFLHLFQYKSEKEKFNSNLLNDLSIEIHSVETFRHTNTSKKTIKIFVGNAKNVDVSYSNIFNKFGMTIYQAESNFILKADAKQLVSREYEDFIIYANAKRKKYYVLEKQYIARVEALDLDWIAKEFKKSHSGGLFDKRSAKVQQQYDCLAFVLYLEFLENKEV